MVQMNVTYLGDLQCQARHHDSGSSLTTDAPKDNQGQGRSFSPTDLLGVSMATCMATIMGIVARREGIDLAGMNVNVEKQMSSNAPRRIAKLTVAFHIPADLPMSQREMLERAARTCPVHHSLHPDVQIDLSFAFGAAG
ncbi:MAG: OsmC family protein [Phycisphaerae bacterium]